MTQRNISKSLTPYMTFKSVSGILVFLGVFFVSALQLDDRFSKAAAQDKAHASINKRINTIDRYIGQIKSDISKIQASQTQARVQDLEYELLKIGLKEDPTASDLAFKERLLRDLEDLKDK